MNKTPRQVLFPWVFITESTHVTLCWQIKNHPHSRTKCMPPSTSHPTFKTSMPGLCHHQPPMQHLFTVTPGHIFSLCACAIPFIKPGPHSLLPASFPSTPCPSHTHTQRQSLVYPCPPINLSQGLLPGVILWNSSALRSPQNTHYIYTK